jgi:hypothetical protein
LKLISLHDRHKSIIAYLASQSLSNSAATLKAELGLDQDAFDAEKSRKYEGLLAKKWTSVMRLQKKVRRNLPQLVLHLSAAPDAHCRS